jgi:hypothetical protein
MRECAAGGIKAAHLFTSGYSEIEDSSGRSGRGGARIDREGGVR